MEIKVIANVMIILLINQTIAEELKNCWPLDKEICNHYQDIKRCTNSKQCSEEEICCRHEFGTTCLAKEKVGHKQNMKILEKCWPLDSLLKCFRYDKACDTSLDCDLNQSCCLHECGTQCRDKQFIGKSEQIIALEKSGLIGKKGCLKIHMDFRVCNPFYFNCKTDQECRGPGHDQRICCVSLYCGTYCADPIYSNN